MRGLREVRTAFMTIVEAVRWWAAYAYLELAEEDWSIGEAWPRPRNVSLARIFEDWETETMHAHGWTTLSPGRSVPRSAASPEPRTTRPRLTSRRRTDRGYRMHSIRQTRSRPDDPALPSTGPVQDHREIRIFVARGP